MLNLVLHNSLPRSGSTLLANLLAQNPAFHCTSTNALLDQLMLVRERWMMAAEFQAQGLREIEPRICSLLRGMIEGFYRDEFAAGKTVFDKCRGWLACLRVIEDVLERPVKVIVCVRDLRDILASFEKIYRRSALTDHPLPPEEQLSQLTVTGRAELLLSPRKVVGYCLASLQGALESGLHERLVIVPYSELTKEPIETVQRVCRECGLTPFTCDPNNVANVVSEDDTVYGMYDLHVTRKVVEPAHSETWQGIFDEQYAASVNERYPLVQGLAKSSFNHLFSQAA